MAWLGTGAVSPGRRHGARALLPALAVLALVALQRSAGASGDRSALVLTWLAVCLVVTATGVAAYLAWRLDDRPGLAWGSAGLLTVGLYGTGGAVLAAARLSLSEPPTPTTGVDLAVVAAAAGCALAARSRPFPHRDPLAVGLAGAGVASLVRALVPTPLDPLPGDTVATVLAVAAIALAFAGGAALLSARVPEELRRSLAVTLALGASVGVVAGGSPGAVDERALGWVAAAWLAAATSAAVLAIRHLGALGRAHHRTVRSLALRASRAEAAREHNQDRMHELKATAAGVASAAEVLGEDLAIPASRRAALSALLIDETDRLRQLTESFERGVVERVELDEVLGRVVGKQRALGQVVGWRPTGLAVEADPQMLREVVDILLVNARTHAPGAWVRVNASSDQERVLVAVHDTGPGVAADVADRLFERGARGAASGGSGVGLSLARRLVGEMGGALRHEPTATGTRFVLTLLPHAEEVVHGALPARAHLDARGAC